MVDKNENSDPKSPHAPEVQDDVQQVMKWLGEYGRPALTALAVAVVVLLGVSIWRGQQQEKAEAAVQALFESRAPEEFRQMAADDPKAPTAPLALATAAAEYYAQGRYDEALSAYQGFLTQYSGHMMAPDAEVGVAASLEALDDFEGAAEAYERFAQANPGSALAPQAVMGAARCREQLGQFDEARALYEDFIVANPDSDWIAQAESGLLFLKKAERASRLPPPVAVPEANVVFDSTLMPTAGEEAAEAEVSRAPEEAVEAMTATVETAAEEAAPEAEIVEEAVVTAKDAADAPEAIEAEPAVEEAVVVVEEAPAEPEEEISEEIGEATDEPAADSAE